MSLFAHCINADTHLGSSRQVWWKCSQLCTLSGHTPRTPANRHRKGLCEQLECTHITYLCVNALFRRICICACFRNVFLSLSRPVRASDLEGEDTLPFPLSPLLKGAVWGFRLKKTFTRPPFLRQYILNGCSFRSHSSTIVNDESSLSLVSCYIWPFSCKMLHYLLQLVAICVCCLVLS